MNMQQTDEIRELTAAELDFVSGGVSAHDVVLALWSDGWPAGRAGVSVAISAIWDAIFG